MTLDEAACTVPLSGPELSIMRQETLRVQVFDAGEAIPDWLIIVDPNASDSKRGEITFIQRVTLIETDEYYMLIPNSPGDVMKIKDADDISLRAAGKTVTFPCRWMTMYGLDDRGRGRDVCL